MNDEVALLEARGITIWRGDNLLVDDLDVCVQAASVMQIQGTNGSGKTTLLRALIGLAEFDEGQVFWCGESVTRVRDDMHAQLLYLGHKSGITGGLTPLENLLALCPELHTHSGRAEESVERVTAVLAELGIEDRIALPSAALSAGQQRRIALSRLRLQQALLWVLDEPLTSLDAQGQAWLRGEIERHVDAGGAVMYTTHQPLAFDNIPVHTLVLADDA